ncbi:Signal transduction histidine kinase [Marivirga sericea]|uniref:histidine kinase n=1 Tax=Marivirga sericea TaxID=1028 RepID=A0A1X7I9F0_9BACT|nr:tetratricopeptide repeat-containing sensor histidine kinase [Marivirga sericea]SMG11019.1 Signal transduction histidine kinase [Marivirga sericea]
MLYPKTYIFVFILISCGCYGQLNAQPSSLVDSLKIELSKAEVKSDQVQILNELAETLKSSDVTDALEYARGALNLAIEIGDKDGILSAYSNLGLVKTYSGDYDSALIDFFKGLHLSDSFDNSFFKARILNNIGNTYWKASRLEDAYQYYKRSLEIRTLIEDSLGMAKSYGNLGNIANAVLHDLDSAEYYYQNALRLFLLLQDSVSISITYINLGNIEGSKGNDSLALRFYSRSLQLDLQRNDLYGATYALSNLGGTYKELKKYDSALHYFHTLLYVAEAVKSLPRKKQAYERLAYIHKELKSFDSAFYYLEKYQSANDSLIDERTQRSMSSLQAEYEKEVQSKQLQILKTKSQLDSEKLETKYWQNLLLVFLVFFLVTGLLILIIRIKEKSKLNTQLSLRQKALEDKTLQLEEAKELIEESHQELLTLNDNLESKVALRTQELNESYQNLLITKERLNHFTYRSAHDLKGPIASILGLCNLMKKDIESIKGNQDETFHYVNLILDTANSMNVLLKRILKSNQLNESILKFEDTNISQLLEEIKEVFQETVDNNNVQLLIDAEDHFIVHTDPTILKLIIKYILKNSFQHINRAQEKPIIEILVESQISKGIKIHIKDNGIGVEPELVPDLFKMFSKGSRNPKNTGLGLYDVNLLAEKIGVSVYYDQDDDVFTHFVISLD